jgi:hypothetical protein
MAYALCSIGYKQFIGPTDTQGKGIIQNMNVTNSWLGLFCSISIEIMARQWAAPLALTALSSRGSQGRVPNPEA